jgi:uncharacterized protein YneF (UPF0154 family)
MGSAGLIFVVLFVGLLVLAGVGLGCFLTHRLMKGLAPIPTLPYRTVTMSEKNNGDEQSDKPPPVRMPPSRA